MLFWSDFKYGRILQTILVSEGLLLLFEVTENPVCTLFLQKTSGYFILCRRVTQIDEYTKFQMQ